MRFGRRGSRSSGGCSSSSSKSRSETTVIFFHIFIFSVSILVFKSFYCIIINVLISSTVYCGIIAPGGLSKKTIIICRTNITAGAADEGVISLESRRRRF